LSAQSTAKEDDLAVYAKSSISEHKYAHHEIKRENDRSSAFIGGCFTENVPACVGSSVIHLQHRKQLEISRNAISAPFPLTII